MPPTPDQFKNLIPAPNSEICPKVIKALLEMFTLIWQDQAYMKNADGTPSDAYKAALGLTVGGLAAPANLAGSQGTTTKTVDLTWSAATGASSYEVWRSLTDDSSTASQVGSPATTSFSDASVTQGTVYFYWVKAVNAGGTSDFSSSASGYAANTPSSPIAFTDSGSWVVPTGVTTIQVDAWGSGGGGGGCYGAGRAPFYGGAGGGSGEYRQITSLAVTPGETLTVVVGIAGAAGSSNLPGGNGQPTQITRGATALLVANPGGGGAVSTGLVASAGGAGGTGGSYGSQIAAGTQGSGGGVNSFGGAGAVANTGYAAGGKGADTVSAGGVGHLIITPNG